MNSKKVNVTDSKGNVNTFDYAKGAADFLKCKPGYITYLLRTGSLYKNEYVVTYEDVDMDETESVNSVSYDIDKNGKIIVCNNNVNLWLKSKFKEFKYNSLNDDCIVDGERVNDMFYKRTNSLMDKEIGVHDVKRLEEEVVSLCVENSFNPLIEQLESVEWDGEKRVSEFFIKYLKAADTSLNRKYTEYWFKAAIKRLYEPGCMWDYMLILQDKTHGTGKSKIFERIGLGYCCINPDISNKDVVGSMQNSWIVNFDELARFDKNDMNNIKTFITSNRELVRLAYARTPDYYDRHCVFCGTTNDEYFLRDYTTEVERRFWIMECKGVRTYEKDWEWLTEDYVLQLWAEARAMYNEDPEVHISFEPEEYEMMKQIHIRHKSLGKDVKVFVRLKRLLNLKYSSAAFNDPIAFEEEGRSYNSFGLPNGMYMDKIDIEWIAAALDRTIDYIVSLVYHIDGWTVKDGFAVRENPIENTTNRMETFPFDI